MSTKNHDGRFFIILHNVRSAHNVGTIFRTADGAGVNKIYLGGYTPTPAKDPKILKTSLGAERYIPWERHAQTWRLLKKLKKEGIFILALEQAGDSIDYRQFRPRFPLALLVGNEVVGLPKEILARADKKNLSADGGTKRES